MSSASGKKSYIKILIKALFIILGWIVGVFFLFAGVNQFVRQHREYYVLKGVLEITIGLLALPPMRKFLVEVHGIKISPLKTAVLIATLFTALFFVPRDFSKKAYVAHAQKRAQTEAQRNSFSFENFSSLQELQNELDKLFPFGTPVAKIDAVLADKMEAFRTDNLIDNHEIKGLYRKGTSTADNYVFYYKPINLAGKNGWEDTSSGWVIKIIHGNIRCEGDRDIDVMMGGSGKGLKQIIALTTPNEQTDGKPDEYILLAKELLQYKEDLIPVDPFSEEEWAALAQEHQNSPCMKNITQQCLMQKILELLNIPNEPARNSYLRHLADTATEQGDRKTGEILLEVWPSGEDIRAYEESVPRLRKRAPSAIEGLISAYHAQYMLLLFLAGPYEEAKTLLTELQQKYKGGNDYKVISSLVKWGELEKASEIVKLTAEWKRETPDPLENSSAHMHCQNYRESRPEAMGM